MNQEARPSPEALLAEAEKEHRGKLKIFFGMAPGVGKTYAMLRSAHERKKDGVDVVIGVVETHGRADTQELVDGLDIMPRKQIFYKGHTIEEMDIDAIIARKPAIVLIDELAHTNAPGSRHPKRYQDVEEILRNGIDVYSTLNVQHLENLNDVVSQITRVRVKEVVPDEVMETAEVTLVDIAPDELIERLKDGKVYIPEQARKAMQHFFTPGNLTALRELALRRTAERVDDQMLSYMQAHAIKGPWPAGERVMVCISDSPVAPKIIRAAKRSAERMHAKWVAVYVESSRHFRLSDESRERVSEAMHLAHRLGGEVVTLTGENIGEEVVQYALNNNVTRIVMGLSRKSGWKERLFSSAVQDVVKGIRGIDIMIVSTDAADAANTAIVGVAEAQKKGHSVDSSAHAYAVSLFSVMLISVVGFYLSNVLGYENILMIFLVPIFVSAVSYGMGPSLFACLISIFMYSWLLSEPKMAFNWPSPSDTLSITVFMLVGVLASNLASRIRDQATAARKRERITGALYEFSRRLAGVGSLNDLLHSVVYHISMIVKVRTVLFLPQEGKLVLRAAHPAEQQIAESEMAAINWTYDNGKPSGSHTETLPSLERQFLPLNTAEGTVGVIGILPEADSEVFRLDEKRLLEALTDQAAIAIQRMEYSISNAKAQLKKLSDTVFDRTFED